MQSFQRHYQPKWQVSEADWQLTMCVSASTSIVLPWVFPLSSKTVSDLSPSDKCWVQLERWGIWVGSQKSSLTSILPLGFTISSAECRRLQTPNSNHLIGRSLNQSTPVTMSSVCPVQCQLFTIVRQGPEPPADTLGASTPLPSSPPAVLFVCLFVCLLVGWLVGCFVALLFCCFVALLLCCFVGLLLCCCVALLLCCFVALLLCCFVALLLCCFVCVSAFVWVCKCASVQVCDWPSTISWM